MDRPLESRLFTERTQRLRRTGFSADHPYVAYGKEVEAAGILGEIAQDLPSGRVLQTHMNVSETLLPKMLQKPSGRKRFDIKELELAAKQTKDTEAESRKACLKARGLIAEALPVIIKEHAVLVAKLERRSYYLRNPLRLKILSRIKKLSTNCC